MQIVKAKVNDINELIKVYHIAVDHMFNENNTNQWQHDEDNFVRLVNKYIDDKNFYIIKENDEIVGFFAMIFGVDITYNQIDGKWINNDPYVTVHKIASKYYKKGIASFMLNYVINQAIKNNVYNIRIDTHKDNISMQSFLAKHNFVKCGVISITCNFNDLNSLRYAYLKQLEK